MGLDVTGCTTIDHNEKIKIEFVNHDSRHLKIASKTCFKILYIRRQIDSKNQTISNFKLKISKLI